MTSPVPKFSEAREMLRRINRMVPDTSALWQMHQMDMFMSIREFFERSESGHTTRRGRTPVATARLIFLKLLVLGVSLGAVARLWLVRPRVLIYSPDKAVPEHDFRIGGLYAYLSAHHRTYTEVFHTTVGQGFYTNLKKRGRVALYLEAWDPIFSLLDAFASSKELSHLDDSLESRFIRQCAKRIRRSAFRIRLLSFVLRLSGVRTLLAIDDPRSYLFEVIAACKNVGITTHAFQHGAYSKYTVGWIDGFNGRTPRVTPDALYVWSTYWKRELARLGSFMPQAAIHFASNPKNLHGPGSVVSVTPEPHQGIHVLMPYETAIPKEEVWACVEQLLACPEVTIYFKTRPDKSIKDQLAEYGAPTALPERFIVAPDLKVILPHIDFVMGVQTTLLYEMVEAGKLVALVKSTCDYSEGMALNGIVDVLDPTTDDMCSRARELSMTSHDTLQERRRILTDGSVHLEEVLDTIFSHS